MHIADYRCQHGLRWSFFFIWYFQDIRHHALTNAKFRDASFGAVQWYGDLCLKCILAPLKIWSLSTQLQVSKHPYMLSYHYITLPKVSQILPHKAYHTTKHLHSGTFVLNCVMFMFWKKTLLPWPPLRNITMKQFKTKVPVWRAFVVWYGLGADLNTSKGWSQNRVKNFYLCNVKIEGEGGLRVFTCKDNEIPMIVPRKWLDFYSCGGGFLNTSQMWFHADTVIFWYFDTFLSNGGSRLSL